MASERAQNPVIDTHDLTELLRQQPLPAPFKLAIYSTESGKSGLWEAIQAVCRPTPGRPPCGEQCFHSWREMVGQTLKNKSPVVRTCPKGFIGFALPFPDHQGLPECLIGGGIRDKNHPSATPPVKPQNLPDPLVVRSHDKHRDSKGQTAQGVPQLSLEEAEIVVKRLYQTLPRLLETKLSSKNLDRTTRYLDAVSEISRDLAKCSDIEQALNVINQAFTILFDLPKILILLKSSPKSISIHTSLGVAKETCQIDEAQLIQHLSEHGTEPQTLIGESLSLLFPKLNAKSACLIPMAESARKIGAVVLLDVILHKRDLALIGLLVGRLAARLERLMLDKRHEQDHEHSNRMVSMISALSLVDNRDHLFNQILEMSVDLIKTSNGSLMLFNETEGTLKIVAARGMHDTIARCMLVQFGEGIAGRVAKSGFPMLVNDIERDSRTATRNRPRFRAKSFISLPLKIEDRLIGVLNLADKLDGSNFNKRDLDVIQHFTKHAVLMVDRVTALEQARQFEKLSITDPLTGLYNRRFLESRLQEEISRCQRQNQKFCLVLADLDNFKLFNDICGHLAGDMALCKTAKLMSSTARDMDVVTRYGGEEFCLILPGTGKKEAVLVGERIRRAIEFETFPGETHLPLGRLTISLGVAAFSEDGQTSAELIHAADLALYRAKDQGRNRLVTYDPSFASEMPLQVENSDYINR
ncbi:MAG: sensor domain-containing diguanylate cyclase [Deltaproteobacteria bacterium]|jgi:diguanylate cyclase (GGDEF)-like protein|nr:sensor domain-containing diguanylate cyclase [Deltaproteobacteria bacterium]